MNRCFLIGRIITKIKFEFMMNSTYFSISIFKIKLENKSEIKIKGYDKVADWCYQHLIEGNKVLIEGSLNDRNEIEIFRLIKIV